MDAIAPESCARIPDSLTATVRAQTLSRKNGIAGFALLARWPITDMARIKNVVNVIFNDFSDCLTVLNVRLTLFYFTLRFFGFERQEHLRSDDCPSP